MFASDALSRILPIQPSGRRVTAAPDDGLLLTGLALGQRLRAKVEATLTNGDFLVRVGDVPLRMQLPPDVHMGDGLDLILIAREPRPTFLLAGRLPGRESVSTALSQAGRFIDDLLHEKPINVQSAVLRGTTALAPSPPTDGTALANALQRAVSESGLFYESHQALWLAGEKSLTSLLHEPQATLAFGEPSSQWQRLGSLGGPSRGEQDSPRSLAGDDPVHPDALPLVRQQLEALETRHFAWQGEVWPGQALEWDLSEYPEGKDDQQRPSTWRTRVRVTLPQLGEVTGEIHLGDDGVQVRLHATAPTTLQALRNRAPSLAQGLEAAGIRLVGLGVGFHGES